MKRFCIIMVLSGLVCLTGVARAADGAAEAQRSCRAYIEAHGSADERDAFELIVDDGQMERIIQAKLRGASQRELRRAWLYEIHEAASQEKRDAGRLLADAGLIDALIEIVNAMEPFQGDKKKEELRDLPDPSREKASSMQEIADTLLEAMDPANWGSGGSAKITWDGAPARQDGTPQAAAWDDALARYTEARKPGSSEEVRVKRTGVTSAGGFVVEVDMYCTNYLGLGLQQWCNRAVTYSYDAQGTILMKK